MQTVWSPVRRMHSALARSIYMSATGTLISAFTARLTPVRSAVGPVRAACVWSCLTSTTSTSRSRSGSRHTFTQLLATVRSRRIVDRAPSPKRSSSRRGTGGPVRSSLRGLRHPLRADRSAVHRSKWKHRRLDGSGMAIPVAAVFGQQADRLQVLMGSRHRAQLGNHLRREARIRVCRIGGGNGTGAEGERARKQEKRLGRYARLGHWSFPLSQFFIVVGDKQTREPLIETGSRGAETSECRAIVGDSFRRFGKPVIREGGSGTAVHAHLVVQVRAGCGTRRADAADEIPRRDTVALGKPVWDSAQMRITGHGFRPMRDLDNAAVAAAPPDETDASGCGRINRGAVGCGEIYAGMHSCVAVDRVCPAPEHGA